MNHNLSTNTIALLEGILETLRETKQDREQANWLLLRSRQVVTCPELCKDLDDYLADTTVANAEEDAKDLIEGLL